MDTRQFDVAARRLADALTRRGVLRVAAGMFSAAVLLASGSDGLLIDVEAKKHKAKKRKKKRRKRAARIASCPADFPVSCPDDSCCPADAPVCCPATSQDPEGSCAPANDRCCNSGQGGGSCPSSAPQCCPATQRDPDGLCALAADTCCTSEQGGDVCPSDFPQCCPPAKGGGCCKSDETCCTVDDDCPGDLQCADFGCCVETVELESAARRRGGRIREVRRR
jgi:hypothetical protein